MQRIFPILLFNLFTVTPVWAATLYDASLGTLPGAQSWVSFAETGSSITYENTATRITTTNSFGLRTGVSSELTAGGLFQHPLMPVFIRADGFEISFSLQILSEAHSATRDDNNDGLLDRAGFSVIALSQDLSGIEIAFFTDKIWVYEDDKKNPADKFTQAENVALDTTKFTDYKLVGSENGYTLFADGINILSGPWRTYHPSGVSPFTDPYDNPSFLFFGDNTQSASSDVLLGDISVVVGPFPEPEASLYPVPIPPKLLAIFFVATLFNAISTLSNQHYQRKCAHVQVEKT